MRRRFPARGAREALAGLVALTLAGAAACQLEPEDRAPIPAGPAFTQPKSDFQDTWAIVRAIGDGTFAERTGIRADLEAMEPLPETLRIEFESGTQVPSSQRDRLKAFADTIRGDADVSLRIVGCSDPSGSEALNQRISQQRAESVAAALEKLGVDEGRFDAVIGRGEDCAVKERVVNVTPQRPAAKRPA
jgi:outer membrane protein OmpA-like peptidoglycan-associated protein